MAHARTLRARHRAVCALADMARRLRRAPGPAALAALAAMLLLALAGALVQVLLAGACQSDVRRRAWAERATAEQACAHLASARERAACRAALPPPSGAAPACAAAAPGA